MRCIFISFNWTLLVEHLLEFEFGYEVLEPFDETSDEEELLPDEQVEADDEDEDNGWQFIVSICSFVIFFENFESSDF